MGWAAHKKGICWGLLCLSAGFLCHCGAYSFRGVSLSPSVKTLSIQPFYTQATLGPPDIGNTFTQRLRQYFERNTTLRIVPQSGDLRLSGAIESYLIESVAPQGASDQSLNYGNLTRIRITVSASYYNTQASDFDFENKKFTFFRDIDHEKMDIVAQEEQIIQTIMDQIILDIFTASLANW